MNDIVLELASFCLYLPVLPLAVLTLTYKQQGKKKHLYFLLVLEQLLFQFAGKILTDRGYSNHIMLNLDSFFFLMIVGLFYVKRSKTILLIGFIFELSCMLFYGTYHGYFVMNGYAYLVTTIFCLIMAWQHVVLIFKKEEMQDLWKHDYFVFNTAIILYLSTTLISTLFENYLMEFGTSYFLVPFFLQITASAVFNLILMRAIWLHQVR